MALLPSGLISATFGKFDEAKITRVTSALEVRPHENGEPDDEQIRWVVAVDLELTGEDVQDIFLDTNNTTTNQIRGKVRGGTEITIAFDSEYWSGSSWKITKDEIIGVGEDGSKQAMHVQTWVATNAWADAPWNP